MVNDYWLAPPEISTPDFIICGAMKSGTTSLHSMLNQHPDVFIPEKEIHFFDRDNIIQHPDFNTFYKRQWHSHQSNYSQKNAGESLKQQAKRYWQWYGQQFVGASKGQVIGEDSTTYLASPLVAKRIALQTKPIKLVIMLRQPSLRAYSQYWHLVRSGLMPHRFEDYLQLNPHNILNRSLYTSQIEQYLKYVPEKNIHFVIFEEFIADKVNVLKGVCQHIGIDYDKLPSSATQLHENAATYPTYYSLQLLKNRLFPQAGNNRYKQHFNGTISNQIAPYKNFYRLINGIHRKINPLTAKKPQKIQQTTKQFLDHFFIDELEGLNELIGRNVLSLWFD